MKYFALSRQCQCLLLCLFVLLAGCHEGGSGRKPGDRFAQRAISVADAIEFTDVIAGQVIGGDVKITRAADDIYDASSYVLRWGYQGQPAILAGGQSNFIARIPIVDSNTSNELIYNLAASVPNGVDSIMVFTANALGDAWSGTSVNIENYIADGRAPTNLDYTVAFTDSSGGLGISGNGKISQDRDKNYYANTGIRSYSIRYADSTGCPIVRPDVPRVALVQRQLGSLDLNFSLGVVTQPYGLVNPITPPADAVSLVAIAVGNTQDPYVTATLFEAFQADCNNYVRTSLQTFNIVYETTTPPAPKRVLISADSDPTEKLTVTITIQPDDERLVKDGYFINWMQDGWCNSQIAFVSKNPNGVHTVELQNLVIPPNTTSISVSGGSKCTSNRVNLPISNTIGPWYLIRAEANSNKCVAVDPNNNDNLKVADCNADYYAGQRFNLRHLVYQQDVGSNLFYEIQSVTTGKCFHRSTNSNEEAFVLRDCNNSKEQQMQLKQFNNVGPYNTKIAVRKDVIGITWWICMPYSSLSSIWGNCDVFAYKTWYFAPGGTSNSDYYGRFNE